MPSGGYAPAIEDIDFDIEEEMAAAEEPGSPAGNLF